MYTLLLSKRVWSSIDCHLSWKTKTWKECSDLCMSWRPFWFQWVFALWIKSLWIPPRKLSSSCTDDLCPNTRRRFGRDCAKERAGEDDPCAREDGPDCASRGSSNRKVQPVRVGPYQTQVDQEKAFCKVSCFSICFGKKKEEMHYSQTNLGLMRKQ
jgi:hypothetical protein